MRERERLGEEKNIARRVPQWRSVLGISSRMGSQHLNLSLPRFQLDELAV